MTPLCPLKTMPGIPRDPRLGLWGGGSQEREPLADRGDAHLSRLRVMPCYAPNQCARLGSLLGTPSSGHHVRTSWLPTPNGPSVP